MVSEETQRKFDEAEKLLKGLERARKFSSKYMVTPVKEVDRMHREMRDFAGSLQEVQNPQSEDELYLGELKRRLEGEVFGWDCHRSGKLYDSDTVLKIIGVPKEDMGALRPWLEADKGKTEEAIERLFRTRNVEQYELGIDTDIPGTGAQAEAFANRYIRKYHKVLGKFLQGLTNVGEYLRDIEAVPTRMPRSYFSPLTGKLAIGVPAICFSNEEGDLEINERELIALYGHEGMGHAMNRVITKSDGVPYFLREMDHLTRATAESVAQFYGDRLLIDLERDPKTQKLLGIEHKFAEIVREAEDIKLIEEYKQKLYQYTTLVLADRSMGDPRDPDVKKRRIKTISEVALEMRYASSAVESALSENHYDSEGNFDSSAISELVYCARPVDRAMREFRARGMDYDNKDDRSFMDMTLLRGFWTPKGFVDNARLRAEAKQRETGSRKG